MTTDNAAIATVPMVAVVFAHDVVGMAALRGAREFVVYDVVEAYGEDSHRLVNAIPSKMNADQEVGISSRVGNKHLFMADCDLMRLAQLKDLPKSFRNSLQVVRSSPGKYHLYGKLMPWEKMLYWWGRLQDLGMMDLRWADPQMRRGHACLRITANVKGGAAHIVPCLVSDITHE